MTEDLCEPHPCGTHWLPVMARGTSIHCPPVPHRAVDMGLVYGAAMPRMGQEMREAAVRAAGEAGLGEL